MTKALRVWLFAVIVCGFQTGTGFAAADWLDKLSGPGPSLSNDPTSGLLGTICFHDLYAAERDQSATSAGIDRRPCFFVDKRRFKNKDDDNFPSDVTTYAFDFGLSWKLLDERVEAGAGAGLMHFGSQNRVTAATAATSRFTVTLPRVVFAPLRVTKWNSRYSRILKLYFREQLITGDLDAEDFATKIGTLPGQSTFKASNEFVRSYGALIDLGEMIFYKR